MTSRMRNVIVAATVGALTIFSGTASAHMTCTGGDHGHVVSALYDNQGHMYPCYGPLSRTNCLEYWNKINSAPAGGGYYWQRWARESYMGGALISKGITNMQILCTRP